MNTPVLQILLIEDNEGDARLIQEVLNETGKASLYRINHVCRLTDGLSYLKDKKPVDIILSDISLPDAKGFTTLNELKQASDHIPIIIITGIDDDALGIEAIHLGAQDYLQKSKFDGEVLMRSIRYARERKKLEQQKDDFLGIASHELKTPVTSLKAFTQLLHKKFMKLGDESSALLASKMNVQIDKLTHLIRDLLDVTKIESGKLQFNESHFNFDGLVKEVVEEMQLISLNHTLVLQGETGMAIFGDRERIAQVLINFISNAIKYSPDSNKVVITISATSDNLVFSVQDFGVGISKETQQKIFERFYRESGVKEDTFPGLGLGLYISNEIIMRMKGCISVESEKGKGSIFRASLPIQKSNGTESKQMVSRL